MKVVLGKISYGMLFVVILPVLLIAWAVRLDELLALPVVGEPWQGAALAIAAAAFIAWAVAVLRIKGGGWPMSPYPPRSLVSSGPFAVIADPIYAGCVALAAGVSIWARSAAGVWIVTPLLALVAIGFVVGYERARTVELFGRSEQRPILRAPARTEEPADFGDRASIYLLVLLPWLIAFEAVNALGIPPDARNGYTRWDSAIAIVPWTEVLYFLDYALVLAVPLIARTRRQLHDFAVRGWVATAAITVVYLTVPVMVIPKRAPAGPFEALMLWERKFDAPLTAFPAFHVVWAFIAAATFVSVWPRLRILWWSFAAAITISCVTTGMHAIADVAAGLVASALVLSSRPIWRWLLDASQQMANSWREWRVGPLRIMSHGAYAAAGAFFGIVIVAGLTGHTVLAVLIGAAVILGAAAWAQWVEGSPQLLRPFGYYGGVLGACIAAALLPQSWLMLAAFCVAGTIIQACGRCRCLVQGCCHGTSAPDDLGIRYTHPRSRVTRLSDLAGRSLHATQLYSIASNIVLFILLMRLWFIDAPLQFIAGVYFMLSGVERFVEEHYRGEPQTPIIAGLRVYQWLAMASFVGGAVMTASGNTPAPDYVPLRLAHFVVAFVFALFTYVAYGVDFPKLNTRFARLV